MNIEKIEYLGFDVEIIYQPFFDDSTARSKQYKVIIKKDGVEQASRYGITYNNALVYYKNWINKHMKNQ